MKQQYIVIDMCRMCEYFYVEFGIQVTVYKVE